MFPTLGLFASVRCPDLSISGGGLGVCKRNPCLFSHVAPPPRLLAITKRPASSSASSSRDDAKAGQERPSKLRKAGPDTAPSAASNERTSLFQSVPDDPEDTGSGPVASSSTIPVGRLRNTTFKKPAIAITRNGQVIKKQILPVQKLASSAYTMSHTPQMPTSTLSSKGKEKVMDSKAGRLPASTPKNSSEPPRIQVMTHKSYFPLAMRNTMLRSIYHEFLNVYAVITPRTVAAELASDHALAQEEAIYTKNNKV